MCGRGVKGDALKHKARTAGFHLSAVEAFAVAILNTRGQQSLNALKQFCSVSSSMA